MLAGRRSLTAIRGHTTDLTGTDQCSVRQDEGQDLPSESTIRRVLQDLAPADPDADPDAHLVLHAYRHHQRPHSGRRGRVRPCAAPPHLLSALDQVTGTILTQ